MQVNASTLLDRNRNDDGKRHEECQGMLDEMRVRLADWMRETNDPLLNTLLLVFDETSAD